LTGEVCQFSSAPAERSIGRRPAAVRVLGAAAPAIFYLLYFLTLIATTGIWWSIHLWLGSVATAGITGYLLSYVAMPPGETASL